MAVRVVHGGALETYHVAFTYISRTHILQADVAQGVLLFTTADAERTLPKSLVARSK